ncbi:hypothetical protein PQX77_001926 [Marasmius sp. AFHP31]|nr:hypothetical protein PQX77_001926 [Marasmius sp. AFHP31]
MPTIPVNTRSGTVHFSYTISTPREASAKTLEAGLPTLLFIHPAYFSSIVYHAQFSDPRLRRFNLVTFDLRCSGFTTGARVKAPYESEEIARDVVAFMHALRLPPCHIVGLGTSTVIAIDLALHHASKCLSLCLLSPLGFPEYNPAIMEGVAQIHSLWKEGMANASNVDKSIIWDALSGLRQFGFNHMRGSSLGDALFQVWFTRALEIWGPDQESIDEFFETTLGFFSYEKTFARSASELKGIRVPVKVIQGSENIINNWPAEYLDKIGELLQEAGIRFDGSLISHAPHVLCLDHGETYVY